VLRPEIGIPIRVYGYRVSTLRTALIVGWHTHIQNKNVIMLHITLAMHSVHASWSKLLNLWSRLTSTQVTCRCQVKSSQVECDQVDGGQLGQLEF